MKCRLNLVLFGIDEKTLAFNIISTNETSVELPFIEVQKYDDINIALNLITSRHIQDLDNISLNFRFSDIYIDEYVNIYYYCFLNYSPKLINSYEVSIKHYDCQNLPNLKKIILGLYS